MSDPTATWNQVLADADRVQSKRTYMGTPIDEMPRLQALSICLSGLGHKHMYRRPKFPSQNYSLGLHIQLLTPVPICSVCARLPLELASQNEPHQCPLTSISLNSLFYHLSSPYGIILPSWGEPQIHLSCSNDWIHGTDQSLVTFVYSEEGRSSCPHWMNPP